MSLAVIGVDVGGTNTDAVILEANKVVGQSKALTSDDVTSGVIKAITDSIHDALNSGYNGKICQINIGTTHFLNAIIERRDLCKVAVIRLCGLASTTLPPFSSFPKDLQKLVRSSVFMVDGGYEFDGSEICSVNPEEIFKCLDEIHASGVKNIAISGVFASIRANQEEQVKELILSKHPEFSITISHEIGIMNLLERENAAILNECLKPLCMATIQRFCDVFEKINLTCPLFFTQNDGTVLSAENVKKFPVFTFSSGPTNSMRGAVLLSGVQNGIVLDIGGTSSDIGLIQNGFPREASTEIKVGGVPTNFRMPDVKSISLGGGSIVNEDTGEVTARSVGNNIFSMAKIYGGNIVTLSDISVVAGHATFGDPNKKPQISPKIMESVKESIKAKIEDLIDEIKIQTGDLPMVIVGGGSVIVDTSVSIRGTSSVEKPPNFLVANAVGAALSQISGSIDENIVSSSPDYEEMLEFGRQKAISNAIANGAMVNNIQITAQSVVPLAYLPGNVARMKIKAIGDLDTKAYQENSHDLGQIRQKLNANVNLPSSRPRAKANFEKSNEVVLQPSEPYVNPKTGEWELSKWDVECLAIGAGILGCGGGGSPYLGRLMLLKSLEKGKIPRIIHPDRLVRQCDPRDIALPVAFYGSPACFNEKISSDLQSINAVASLNELMNIKSYDDLEINEKNGMKFVENYQPQSYNKSKNLHQTLGGKRIACVYAAEVGGMNAIEPLVFGAKQGIVIADIDGIGRAVPELQMVYQYIQAPETAYPLVITDVKGSINAVFESESLKSCEDYLRGCVVKFGGVGLIAASGLNLKNMRKVCIGGSLTRSWKIGNAVLKSRHEKESPFKRLMQQEKGKIICFGKVVNVVRMNDGAFSRGVITISESSKFSERKLLIDFQNEYLLARWIENSVENIVATVPDLITIVDHDTCMPITSGLIEYGQKVGVLHLPPPVELTKPTSLAVLGPQAFGYNHLEYNSDIGVYKESFIPLP